MKVYLTGSNGFVGQRICISLKRQGISVVEVHSPNSKKEASGDALTFDDFVESKTDFSQEKGKVFVHSGWAGVLGSQRNELQQFQNVADSLKLFSSALENNFEHFLFIGSQAEYADTAGLITENSKILPQTKYGISKVLTFQAMKNFQELYEKDILTHARIFDVYGPSDNPNWLIPTVIHKLKNNLEMQLTSGHQIWNFIHVRDVADAIIKIINSPPMGAVNLCSDDNQPLRHFLEMIGSIMGKQHLLKFGELAHHSGMRSINGDNSKLKTKCNWKQQIPFEVGIKELIEEATAIED